MANLDVILMVISLVACVLGLAFVGMYFLNKAVDQNSC